MAKKRSKSKKDMISLITNDLMARGAKASTKMRSLLIEAYREAKCNKLGLLNLSVTLYMLVRVIRLDERMQDISHSILAAAIGGYVNTMVAFQHVVTELQRLLEIFGGDKV